MEALEALVIAAQHGDSAAFDRLVERFAVMAYGCAYAMVGDALLAEEVMQEAFIEAYVNLPRLREPLAFPGWLRRVVFKQGDRSIRGKRVTTVPLEVACEVPEEGLNPEVVVEERERNEMVRQAVEALPEHERIVMILFYGTGYALKEIAGFLEVPVTTVKKRLHDGRKRLRDELLETVPYALYEQRSAFAESLPDIVRLLLAARMGDVEGVKAVLEHKPMLVNMRAERRHEQVRGNRWGIVGHTALHEAASGGHVAVAELLLAYGANVHARANYGLTALHEAAFHRHEEVVRLLLAKGADVNAVYSNGHTPLHWAAMKGYTGIVQLLLEHRVEVNRQSYFGRTALHWAALKGYREVVQLLLASGADANVRDEAGRTALDWAMEKGYKEVVNILERIRTMKDKNATVPVGIQVLGRVLNARGEPIDGKGSITEAQRVPLYSLVAGRQKAQGAPEQLWETGIKVIDLLAPIARGGMVEMFAGVGQGKQVVLEEIVHNMASRRNGYMVGLGMDNSTYEASELMAPIREGELESKVVMVFERLTDAVETIQQLVWVGATIAQHFVEQGHEVILVIDKNVAGKMSAALMRELRGATQEQRITTLLLRMQDDVLQGEGERDELDGRIVFSSELARKDLWPAVDRLRSGSRLLAESSGVSAEHVEVAQQLRQLLGNPDTYMQEPAALRAKKIQNFLTQPFFVAEAYTDMPGEYVGVEDTIKGCRELLEGRYDDVPLQAFWFVGTIEQALQKAKGM